MIQSLLLYITTSLSIKVFQDLESNVATVVN